MQVQEDSKIEGIQFNLPDVIVEEQHHDSFYCYHYGCELQYDPKNNKRCYQHSGKWDFGHSGNTVRQIYDNKEVALWKPHWTCCGQEWESKCSKY